MLLSQHTTESVVRFADEVLRPILVLHECNLAAVEDIQQKGRASSVSPLYLSILCTNVSASLLGQDTNQSLLVSRLLLL